MEQIAEESIDFILLVYLTPITRQIYICLGYLLVTAEHAVEDKTPLEDDTISVLLRMEHVCCDSFSMGTLVLLSHLKTSVQLFVSLALNPTSCLVF